MSGKKERSRAIVRVHDEVPILAAIPWGVKIGAARMRRLDAMTDPST